MKRILLIEDNDLNLKLLKSLLNLGGYDTLHAPDAETGIGMVHKHQPDLIFMDINLPGMNGLEATRLLKAEKISRDIPIIALTSHAMNGDEKEAINAGCSAYITKPINTRTFLTDIKPYVTNHGSDAESIRP